MKEIKKPGTDTYFQITLPSGITSVVWATSRSDLIHWLDKQKIAYTKIVELH